jgi:hypothetical protein
MSVDVGVSQATNATEASVASAYASEVAKLIGSPTVAPILGTPSPASTRTGPVIIAVVDSGVDANSSDPFHYNGNTSLLDLTDAYNAVDGTYGQAAVLDTTARGTIATNHVAQGVAAGVAAGGSSNVKILPIKVYDTPSDGTPFYALVGGIDHAVDAGASVIALGPVVGAQQFDAGQVSQLQAAITYAQNKGVAVVVSSGGGDDGTGSSPGVNIDPASGYLPQFPATFHTGNMLTVEAVNSQGQPVGTSNHGSVHVDLGAPLNVASQPSSTASGYAAGVVGVVAATRTDWSIEQVLQRVKATVQPDASLNGQTVTGGEISPNRALAGIASAPTPSVVDDLAGSGRSDFTVYVNQPGVGNVFKVASATQGYESAYPTYITNSGYGFGGPGSIPLTGNFEGTGVNDPAVYGPEYGANGQPDGKYDLAILSTSSSPLGQYQVLAFAQGVGGPYDVPVVGDFDGDGKADVALYGPHNGQYNFLVLTAASNFDPTKAITINNNGQSYGGSSFVPVAGNFDGSSKTDVGLYGPEIGANGAPDGKYVFAYLSGKSNYTQGKAVVGFGGPGDIPVVGNFTGSGLDDLALYGYVNNTWGFGILTASSGFNLNDVAFFDNAGQSFGGAGYVPVVGQFTGTGQDDLAVWGPEYGSNGQLDGNDQLAALSTKPGVNKGVFINGLGNAASIPTGTSTIVKYFLSRFG